MFNMNSKLRSAGLAGISLGAAALMTIFGYGIRGLVWERPAVEVKRVEADAAVVAARAETERARAELQKAQAEAAKAQAEAQKAQAELQKAQAQVNTSVAEREKALAANIEADAHQAEVVLIKKVANPYIGVPAEQISNLSDVIARYDAQLKRSGLTAAERASLQSQKAAAEEELDTVMRGTVLKIREASKVVFQVVAELGQVVSKSMNENLAKSRKENEDGPLAKWTGPRPQL